MFRCVSPSWLDGHFVIAAEMKRRWIRVYSYCNVFDYTGMPLYDQGKLTKREPGGQVIVSYVATSTAEAHVLNEGRELLP